MPVASRATAFGRSWDGMPNGWTAGTQTVSFPEAVVTSALVAQLVDRARSSRCHRASAARDRVRHGCRTDGPQGCRRYPLPRRISSALVAQLDRAPGFEPGGGSRAVQPMPSGIGCARSGEPWMANGWTAGTQTVSFPEAVVTSALVAQLVDRARSSRCHRASAARDRVRHGCRTDGPQGCRRYPLPRRISSALVAQLDRAPGFEPGGGSRAVQPMPSGIGCARSGEPWMANGWTAGTQTVSFPEAVVISALVAQLDRAPGFEPGGRGFESLRARQPVSKPLRSQPRRDNLAT